MGLIAVAGSDLQIREGAVMHPDPEIRWGFLEICFRPFRPQFGPKLTRRRGRAAKKMRPGQCTNPSRESWDDLSGDQYIICPKPPSPAGKILDRRQLFFLANHNSLEQTPHTRQNLPPQDSRDGFFFVHCPGLIFLAARWSGQATSWHVYFPLEFEFRGKSCVKREHGGEDGISCLLACILLLYIGWI